VQAVALTYEQAVELKLPSTPLKATERRADKWRAHWGHEQTEVDEEATRRLRKAKRAAAEAAVQGT
jgi:hypothetical protein